MKKVIIIHGNQEDPTGNPVPYFRTTQRGQFNKGAKRYHAWKDFVRAHYLDKTMPTRIKREDYGDFHDILQKKPIPASKEKQRMTLHIVFANKAHADCDNIFKGIADALFENDKYLVGSFDFEYSPHKKGRVEITLEL